MSLLVEMNEKAMEFQDCALPAILVFDEPPRCSPRGLRRHRRNN